MKLADIQKMGRIGYRHSPKHFVKNSFRLEQVGGRIYVTGTPKRYQGKNYRVLGVLKEK